MPIIYITYKNYIEPLKYSKTSVNKLMITATTLEESQSYTQKGAKKSLANGN